MYSSTQQETLRSLFRASTDHGILVADYGILGICLGLLGSRQLVGATNRKSLRYCGDRLGLCRECLDLGG